MMGDFGLLTVQELLGQGSESFSEGRYQRALEAVASVLCDARTAAATSTAGLETIDDKNVGTLQSIFEGAELLLQRLARWAKEGLVESQRCVHVLQCLMDLVSESLLPSRMGPAAAAAADDDDDSDSGNDNDADAVAGWCADRTAPCAVRCVLAQKLLVMLYACCVRTLCCVDFEWVNRVLREPNQGLERLEWLGEAYLPMIQVYAELRERWLLRQDPVSIQAHVKATENRIQLKILNEMIGGCNGATLTALSQQLLLILQQALRIDWWWRSAGYELETALNWACVLRFVLAAAPVSALSDMLCIVEMEALAEPALGEMLLSSLTTEIDSLASKKLSLSACLRVDLSLCFRLAEAEATSALAQEQAAALLWRHGQSTAVAASGQVIPSEMAIWAPEPILSEIFGLSGMEHAALPMAELAFQWMQLCPAQGVRTISGRLKGVGHAHHSLRLNQSLKIRRRGRRRTHEQISPRSFFLQRCAIHVLTELFGHHSGARKEILSACLSAMAEADYTLPTRTAYCTVIERIASSPSHRIHLRDLSECLLLWLRQLMIEFPISLAKRLLATLAPLGALWQPMGDGLLLFLRKLATSRAIRARRIAAHGLACLLVAPYLPESTETEITQLLLKTLDLAPEPLRAEIFLAMGSAIRVRVPRFASLSLWMASLSRYVEAVSTEPSPGVPPTPHLDLHRCFHAAGVAIEALPELLRCIFALPLTSTSGEWSAPSQASAMTSRAIASSPEMEASSRFLETFLQHLVTDLSEASTVLRMLGLDLLLQRRASSEAWLAPIERIRIAESRCRLLARCYETLLDVGPFSPSQQATLLELYGQLTHLSDSLLPVLANSAARQRPQLAPQATGAAPTTDCDYIAGARAVNRQILSDPSRLFLWKPSTVRAAEVASDLAYASSRQDGEHGGFLHDTLSWVHVVPALGTDRAVQLLAGCSAVYGTTALIRILRRHLDIEVYFRDLRGSGDYFVADQTWSAWLRQAIVGALLRLVAAVPEEPRDVPVKTASLQSAFLSLDLECSSVVRDSIELQSRPAFAQLWLKAHTLDFLAAVLPRWPARQLIALLADTHVRSQLEPVFETEFSEWRASDTHDGPVHPNALKWLAALLTRRLRADFHRGLTVKLVSIYETLIAHLVIGSSSPSDTAEQPSDNVFGSIAFTHIERDLQGILFDFEIPQASVYRLLLRPLLLVLGSERALELSAALVRICRSAADPNRDQRAIYQHPLVEHFAHASAEARMAALGAVIEFGAEKMPRVRVKTEVARAHTLHEKDLVSVRELMFLLETFFAPGELIISLALLMRALALSQQALHYLQGVGEMLRRQLTSLSNGDHKKPRKQKLLKEQMRCPWDEAIEPHWTTVLRCLQQTRAIAGRLGRLVRPDAVREALDGRPAASRSANQACARFVYRLERYEAECSQLDNNLARWLSSDLHIPASLRDSIRCWFQAAPTASHTEELLRFTFVDWDQAATKANKAGAPTRRVCYLRSRNAYIDQVLQHERADDAYADLEDFIATEEATTDDLSPVTKRRPGSQSLRPILS
ncbi:hypothetical protein CCYA_CCYA07G1997 [Cyanidiococcus yangmingshanensis]|nr:hypothetical protein CCYA_CCYA07G1997 [Cyanidiococcus yangmingshanensis]